jgi:hypothetical protein
MRRKTAYLPPGIYGNTMLALLFSGYRVVIEKSPKKKPARRKGRK